MQKLKEWVRLVYEWACQNFRASGGGFVVTVLAGGGAYPFDSGFWGDFAGGVVRIAGLPGIYRAFTLPGSMDASSGFCGTLADFGPFDAVKVVPGRFQGGFERPGKHIIRR